MFLLHEERGSDSVGIQARAEVVMSRYSIALDKQLAALDVAMGTDFQRDDRDHIDGVKTTLVRAVVNGDTYYIGPDICDLLQASVKSLPPTVLRPEIVPTQSGYVWFDKDMYATGFPFNGLVWTAYDDGLGLSTLCFQQDARGIMPVISGPWGYGDTHEREWPADSPEVATGAVEASAILGSLFLLLNQRILSHEPEQVDRATRRRAADFRPEPVVRVIKLRRTTQHESIPGEHGVEWSCQWLVRGFWRQQWYPSLGIHQPKWIAPFVKGPADRPLKVSRATVYAVVR